MIEQQGIMPRLQIDVTPSAGTGGTLRQTRESQGLGVEDVCRRLRYSPDTVLALENERFERLPEPIFAIGYIKGYARFLGLDPAPMIAQYRAKTGVVPEQVVVPELTRRVPRDIAEKLPIWGAVAVGIVATAWLLWAGFVGEAPESGREAMSTTSGVPGEVAATAPGAAEAGMSSSVEEPDGEQERVGASRDTGPERAEIARFENPPTETADQRAPRLSDVRTDAVASDGTLVASAVSAKGPDVLAMAYNAGSWTEVYDADNRRLLFDLVTSGDQRTVEGRAPFRIRLGKSDAVDIKINGAPFDHARFARPDRTALFTVAVNGD